MIPLKEKLLKVMHFENEQVLDEAVEALDSGRSVLLETELYCGNGKWRLGEYRYKMIVPSVDKTGRLYSTDVFKTHSAAIEATYEIYICTRQNVLRVVRVLPADLSDNRYGFGYTQDSYGRFTLKDERTNGLS